MSNQDLFIKASTMQDSSLPYYHFDKLQEIEELCDEESRADSEEFESEVIEIVREKHEKDLESLDDWHDEETSLISKRSKPKKLLKGRRIYYVYKNKAKAGRNYDYFQKFLAITLIVASLLIIFGIGFLIFQYRLLQQNKS